MWIRELCKIKRKTVKSRKQTDYAPTSPHSNRINGMWKPKHSYFRVRTVEGKKTSKVGWFYRTSWLQTDNNSSCEQSQQVGWPRKERMTCASHLLDGMAIVNSTYPAHSQKTQQRLQHPSASCLNGFKHAFVLGHSKWKKVQINSHLKEFTIRFGVVPWCYTF